MEGIDNLDTSEHATYTEEEPNALERHEVGPFLARFREWHPRLYAMVYLMLVTGLRPSSIRPLRRRGGNPTCNGKRVVSMFAAPILWELRS